MYSVAAGDDWQFMLRTVANTPTAPNMPKVICQAGPRASGEFDGGM